MSWWCWVLMVVVALWAMIDFGEVEHDDLEVDSED